MIARARPGVLEATAPAAAGPALRAAQRTPECSSRAIRQLHMSCSSRARVRVRAAQTANLADAPGVTQAPTAVGVVVVGGGPSGYTAAMAMSNQGFQDILILERSESAGAFNPTTGFIYNISGPGRAALREIGVPRLEDIGLTRAGMSARYLQPDGAVDDKEVMMGGGEEPENMGTWLPRHTFNDTMHGHLQQHHSDHVKVDFNTKVDSIQLPDADGQPLIVTATTRKGEGESPETRAFTCRLLIAADGANSTVRESLRKAQPDSGWEMQVSPSDAGGLAYKVLPLPPNPTLSKAGGKLINTQTAVAPGKPVGSDSPLRLGLLAIKDLDTPRTANFILWPSHPFWKVSTTDELYKYLESAFPQLDCLRENVPEAVAKEFVDSRLGRFKDPQGCNKLVAEFPGAEEAEVKPGDAAGGLKGASVLILGDAAHVFPPDIGQGVNAALLDVWTLSKCIANSPQDLGAALRQYEATRLPENEALIRTMQFAFPYQYNQAGMGWKKTLWSINCAIRLLLSKVLPQLFFPPVALTFAAGSKEHQGGLDTLYQYSLAQGNRTTRNLLIILAAAVVGVAAFMSPLS